MNREETITQSKLRLLWASSKNEMDSHQKFGSSVETDDATHTKTKWKRFRTHIMELFWAK